MHVKFGCYCLDTQNRRLTRDGEMVPVAPKSFELLSLFLDQAGRLVTREQIHKALWPGVHVEETAIPRLVSDLRKVLGETAAKPVFIHTVSKAGYRFEIPPPEAVAARPRKWKSVLLAAGLCAAALALGASSTLLRTGMPGNPGIRSLVVLPLEPLSQSADDRVMAYGVSDMVTALLASSAVEFDVHPFRLLGEGWADPVVEGRKRRADFVAHGSFHRLRGVVRVTLRLVQVSSGQTLVSDTIQEREDSLPVLEERLAQRIARALASMLGPVRSASLPSTALAHAAYLRGRYELAKRSPESVALAIQQFSLAASLEPDSAATWAGLANAHLLQAGYGFAPVDAVEGQAQEALRRALALDPDSAEANTAQGLWFENFRYDFPQAQQHYRRALARDPRSVEALDYYGELLTLAARPEEGFPLLHRAESIDPTSHVIQADLCKAYSHFERWQEALRHCRQSLELAPASEASRFVLLYVLWNANATPFGSPAELKRLASGSSHPAVLACAGAALADQAMLQRARLLLAETNQHERFRAMATACLGDLAASLDALEAARQDRAPELTSLLVARVWDPLRSQPRFQALASGLRLRLPAAPGKEPGPVARR